MMLKSIKSFTLMTVELESEQDKLDVITEIEIENDPDIEVEKVLCPHCQRTATNGIKCKGICVADNEY